MEVTAKGSSQRVRSLGSPAGDPQAVIVLRAETLPPNRSLDEA
jgi:hypothetical protein